MRNIHLLDDGNYVISEDNCWRPGSYVTRTAAAVAFSLSDETLQAVQDEKNKAAGGKGGLITMDDLMQYTEIKCGTCVDIDTVVCDECCAAFPEQKNLKWRPAS